MVKKLKSIYVCDSCNYEALSWQGQCPGCKEWNTLVETLGSSKSSGNAASGAGRSTHGIALQQLSAVKTQTSERVKSHIGEFDRLLGGGFVPGKVVLLAGDPGIGKSTLLMQLAAAMQDKKVLYICGEESPNQIKVRAERMKYKADNLYLLNETDVLVINSIIETSGDFSLIIVDSIQTLSMEGIASPPGSVAQVRESSHALTALAKRKQIPMVLVGHVTKDGNVAGPKVLEHLVDTVLYLEGDSQHMYRLLKTTKNRFGAVSEIGMFEMMQSGMVEVANPSKIFLSEKLSDVSGSCVTIVMEGMRPLLFEIQALVTKTAFGYPRRTASGFNVNRLNVLIAIIEKRCSLNLSSHDIFINVAGGYKVAEYACDLAVCLAIISSLKDRPLGDKFAAFGECGLSGEIRHVTYEDNRVKEAKKLGYDAIINAQNTRSLKQAVSKFIS